MSHDTPATDTSTRDFWVERNISKSKDPHIRDALEQWAKSGKSMSYFSLSRCQLAHVNLVSHSSEGFDLSHADLYHADLNHAHLFAINLEGASLMKANLQHANLHCANLTNCNLLGVKLDNAKLDHVTWGSRLLQETQGIEALRQGNAEQAKDYFQQAEETYRNLRIHLEKSGLFEQAGNFFFREMVMRRFQLPFGSSKRVLSFLIDRLCGYGERPLRVIGFSLVVIALCAVVYFFSQGVLQNGQPIGLHFTNDLITNVKDFFSCLYFSVVTFTTLGYGDLTPTGATRIMAAVEAFTGSFTMALFVVVFVKKMTR